MRNFPEDEYDQKELERLNAEPWQVELLKLNPDYPHWGPLEDYMAKGEGRGWESSLIEPSWAKLDLGLNDLNEVVNFYFALEREDTECDVCAGKGYHPDAQWVSESFYSHSSPFKMQTYSEYEAETIMDQFRTPQRPLHGHMYRTGSTREPVFDKYGPGFSEFCNDMIELGHWGERLDEQDLEALKEAGRTGCGPLGHDLINQSILVEARLKRYGIPKDCEKCEGHGRVFTAERAHVSLTLWLLHPRKGASRGVRVERIEQSELPAVFAFLREARERNAARFSKIPEAL